MYSNYSVSGHHHTYNAVTPTNACKIYFSTFVNAVFFQKHVRTICYRTDGTSPSNIEKGYKRLIDDCLQTLQHLRVQFSHIRLVSCLASPTMILQPSAYDGKESLVTNVQQLVPGGGVKMSHNRIKNP